MRDAIALFLASLAAVGILRGKFALLLASLVAMGILAADYKLSGIVRVRKTDVQTMLQEFKTLSPDARERVKPLLLKAIKDGKITYYEKNLILKEIERLKEREMIKEISRALSRAIPKDAVESSHRKNALQYEMRTGKTDHELR